MTPAELICCIPGQRICGFDEEHVAGDGTYSRQGYIISTLLGFVRLKTLSENPKRILVEVHPVKKPTVVPAAGDVVTAKVMSVNPRFVKVSILCVKEYNLAEPFHGLIRKEDVRATEKDKVDLGKSFRPGDIILARVLSLGDASAYLLTTAENELGVVMASSEAGALMVPVGWEEMQCPVTFIKQYRKVAKVISLGQQVIADSSNSDRTIETTQT